MKFIAFVGSDRPQPEEAVAAMNRGFPAYLEEMDRRGVRLFGRELDLPQTGATVRVRAGETVVSDGPFAESKEWVAGLDLLECADLDEAIEVEGKSPVAQFLPFEIRPFEGEPRLGAGAPAFGQGDDSAGVPYLLIVWAGGAPPATPDNPEVMAECDVWRQELEARGAFILGSALGGSETATTIRFRDGKLELRDGPFLDIDEYVAAIEIISCSDRRQAIDHAAAHPLARHHPIEVRPFSSE